jgi:hypothetical protein
MGLKVTPISYMLLALGVIGLAFTSCGRSEAEYQKILAENQRLKAELATLTPPASQTVAAGEAPSPAPEPDLDVTIDELWAQRFDDNEFRSRQRLAGKTIRVAGLVDSVSDDSILLLGTTERFGNVRMKVNLNSTYLGRTRAGIASLEGGLPVTVQGTFLYDRTWLTDAVVVDRNTGQTLSSSEILSLISRARAGAPVSPHSTPQ